MDSQTITRKPLPGWYSAEEGAVLKKLAKESSVNKALEIGTMYGRSTMYILEGLVERFGKDFTLYCIDPWICSDERVGHPAEIFFKELYERELDRNVITLKITGKDSWPIILQHQYGFCHIDGDHNTLPELTDILICSYQTDVLAVHDYGIPMKPHEQVTEAVDFFVKHSDWEIEEVVKSLAVLRLQGQRRKLGYSRNQNVAP